MPHQPHWTYTATSAVTYTYMLQRYSRYPPAAIIYKFSSRPRLRCTAHTYSYTRTRIMIFTHGSAAPHTIRSASPKSVHESVFP